MRCARMHTGLTKTFEDICLYYSTSIHPLLSLPHKLAQTSICSILALMATPQWVSQKLIPLAYEHSNFLASITPSRRLSGIQTLEGNPFGYDQDRKSTLQQASLSTDFKINRNSINQCKQQSRDCIQYFQDLGLSLDQRGSLSLSLSRFLFQTCLARYFAAFPCGQKSAHRLLIGLTPTSESLS